MTRTVLEQAFSPDWIDDVFAMHRRYQYARELLFSTVVELVTLVVLGLRPSLHAAARRSENLPVSLTALYDKVNRTEPEVLRALVEASAARLAPAMADLGQGTILPGWSVRVLYGNHFPGTEKRIPPLRGHRGAAGPSRGGLRSGQRPRARHGGGRRARSVADGTGHGGPVLHLVPAGAPAHRARHDDTFDAVYGSQQLRQFNAHHDEYGFQPILVFDGEGRFVAAVLRPARRPKGIEIRGHLRRLVRAIRAHWPRVEILSAPTATTACPR